MLTNIFPRRAAIGTLVLAAIVGGLATARPAYGQALQSPGIDAQSNQATISAGSGSKANGVLSMNIASGDNNQQIGAVVVASGGSSQAEAGVSQRLLSSSRSTLPASAAIGDDAFAGARGLISINVAAGNDNQEANVAVLGAGFDGPAASDALLAQTRASTDSDQSKKVPARGSDAAAIAPSAFGNSQGLLQVNLIAGERNSSANIFALTMSAGGPM